MIVFQDINSARPYELFVNYYNKAIKANQNNIEAMCISSYDSKNKFVDSRFVNLKYIENNEWIFFSSYSGPKSQQFKSNNQVSVIFYWSSIDVQIRMRASIKKTSKDKSNKHFKNRSKEKNALAIASDQSQKTISYDIFIENYNEILNNNLALDKGPEYWGGYSFKPFYFEFWQGHESRLNRREVFEFIGNRWINSFLQP